MTTEAVLETYFLELRSRLLDIAATLDRLDRASDAGSVRAEPDPRLTFVHDALAILDSDQPQRAKRIQDLYSLR